MLRSSSALIVVAFVPALLACGDDDSRVLPSLESLFPADRAVGGWVENRSIGSVGIETANTASDVHALLNDDAAPFTSAGFAAWGREYYTDGSASLELRIWQMQNAAAARTVYQGIVTLGDPLEHVRYSAANWQDLGIGDAGRITDTGSSYWVTTRKNLFVVEASDITPRDTTSRDAAVTLVGAIVDAIP